jgi:CO/xanthine dehydrogenase Mo-binding subunit
MQIEGGAVMGFGFACCEDLMLVDGRVWAANLGEFKIPSSRDVPELVTVTVPGAVGLEGLGIKSVGELANVPTAAAIVNAIADAVGVRVRDLPVRGEKVLAALTDTSPVPRDNSCGCR